MENKSEDNDIQFLIENGFEKKKCIKCGALFWTKDKYRNTCGEAPCDPYSFLNNPPTKRKYTLEEMREEFLSFFESRNHKRIKRYPIVARWREDVFLVNASIYDFQPHVTSGKVPPPGNPLVISQPCIRTVDLDNVGKTGRHLSVFEMGGAKSFNFPNQFVYWKDDAVRLAIEFLNHLGVETKDITFKDKPWYGGGNAGSAVEVMVAGLEVATLVFMDMIQDPDGPYEFEGVKYKKMENKIVDTGYGIERFTWLSQGTTTIYDAIYPDLTKMLMEEVGLSKPEFLVKFMELSILEDGSEKKFLESLSKEDREVMEKLSAIYMLVDHTRAITFLVYDGLVPSNSKAGYVLRMLIRRALMAMDKVGIKEKLWDLIEIQKERFKDILDLSMERSAREIIELEEERFRDLLLKGDQLILRYAKKGVLTQEAINTLFQSNGLPIEYTIERARQLGIKLPDKVEKAKGFVNVREPAQKKEKPKIVNKYNPTKKSYYEDERKLEFKGNVLGAEGNYLILDETYFYPEGGGQPSDHGYIVLNGNKYEVRDVQLVDDVVVHILDKEIQANKGDIILGHIDEERRIRLMQHHSGTHILLSSIRYVLGNHVWQAGAQKDPYLSRLDITHYKDINAEEIKQIERRANEVIQMNLRLRKEFVERNQAEQKYGFILYQGGIPEGKQLRLVEIPGVDVEGCGGTHVERTGDVGLIKIIKIEKIQDGIYRFHFKAGRSAVEHYQEIMEKISKIENLMGEDPEKTFIELNSELDSLKKSISKGIEVYEAQGIKFYKLHERIADEFSRGIKDPLAVIVSAEKIRVVSNSNINAGEIMRALEKEGIAKGGGSQSYAQGKILKENFDLKQIADVINDNR